MPIPNCSVAPMCRPDKAGCCGVPPPPYVEADSCAQAGLPTCAQPPCPKPPYIFPSEEFLAEFPEFGDTASFSAAMISRTGTAAKRFITDWRCNFPLPELEDRQYALFLMTAHMLALRKNAADEMANGSLPAGGRVRKAVVGAVTVETDVPKTTGDYNYWLAQTSYGQELLAYLENAAPAGIFTNCYPDTVRVL